MISTLDKLNINEKGTVSALTLCGSIKRRMLDLGLATGTEVECIGRSPSGDPSAYLIRGAVIAVRARDACGVVIDTLESR